MSTRLLGASMAAVLAISAMAGPALAGQSVGVMGQAEDASPERVPVPSEGCGVSDVEPDTLHGQTLVVGDDERRWSLYVPDAHSGTDPVPLWVQLHGNQGADVTAVAPIALAAETHGFVVVAPNGHRRRDWAMVRVRRKQPRRRGGASRASGAARRTAI